MEKDSLKNIEVLAIGGSAGSLEVILTILPHLDRDISIAIIIILHRKNSSDSVLTDLFASKTRLIVKEAEEKESILPGTIYVAPADYHLLIEADKTFSLDYSEKILYSRPSIDATYQSAALVYKSSLAGLLLSGANTDGSEGLLEISKHGGITVIQDPPDAEMEYMPRKALLTLQPDLVLKANEMAKFINQLGKTI